MRKIFVVIVLVFAVFVTLIVPQKSNAVVESFIGEIRLFAGDFVPRGCVIINFY